MHNIVNVKNNSVISRYEPLILITVFSIIPCFLYNIMLYTKYNTYLLTSIAKLIMFIGFPYLCFMITKQSTVKSIIKPSGNRKFLKISALFGIGCALFIILAFIIMGDLLDNNQIISGLANEGIMKATYPFVFINIVFVNAFLEEFFFRGFVFLTIYKMGYEVFAYIYSSILFSLYHTAMIGTWFSPLIFMICMVGLVGAGLIFNEIAKRCDNIYGSYLVHLGANIGINLIGAYLFLK